MKRFYLLLLFCGVKYAIKNDERCKRIKWMMVACFIAFFCAPFVAQAAGTLGNPIIISNINSVPNTNASAGLGYTFASPELTIIENGYYEIRGTTTANRIVVDPNLKNVNIILNGVSITSTNNCAFSITNGTNASTGSIVNLTLVGVNTLTSGLTYAGLYVSQYATLTISGSGKLTATGGNGNNPNESGAGAGIGGNGNSAASRINGTIIIYSGIIDAKGGDAGAGNTGGGAGIGGGGGNGNNGGGTFGSITIYCGDITATGGNGGSGGSAGGGGAGIGGGGAGHLSMSGGSNNGGIYILLCEGGKVKAKGGGADKGCGGAGIGGGGAYSGTGAGKGNNIQIDGFFDVTAEGGKGTTSGCNASAIGDGGQNTGSITMNITRQPVDMTVAEGYIDGIELDIMATITSGKIWYQWFQYNEITRTWDRVSAPHETGNFQIPVTLTEGVYSFYCEVTATTTSTFLKSREVKVTVQGDPVKNLAFFPEGNPLSFETKSIGYGVAPILNVTIYNTGTFPFIGSNSLTVAWGDVKKDGSPFYLPFLSGTPVILSDLNLAIGRSAEFTLTTVTGLLRGTYTATVTVSNSDGFSDSFIVQFVVVPKEVKSIVITQDPTNLIYFVDESLDLSGLKVKLTYIDNTTVNLVYGVDEFTEYGIYTVPSGNTPMNASHHGEPVTVKYNNQIFDNTISLISILYPVNVSSIGTSPTGSGNYPIGATVNIFAGARPAGKQFTHWTSDVDVTFDDVNSETTSFTMPASSVTVTAHYKDVRVVTFSVVGGASGNGNISAKMDGTEIVSGDLVEVGKDVIFTASPNPASDYRVLEWKLNGAVIEGNKTNNYTLFNLEEDAVVTVTFELIPPLTGTAIISNMEPRIGDVLTGSLVGGNNTGTLTYIWKANGIEVGRGENYTVKLEDVDKVITLEISSSIEKGKVVSDATEPVKKRTAPPAPSAPTIEEQTHNSVTLSTEDDGIVYEYSLDGENWQKDNMFGDLDPETEYTFYVRIAETDDTEASEASAGSTVTTDEAPVNALTGRARIDNMSPRIGDVLTGSLSNGNSVLLIYKWRVDGQIVQSGTDPTYTVTLADLGKEIVLIIEAEDRVGSVTSRPTTATLKRNRLAPDDAPCVEEVTHNSVTLCYVEGYEYSLDGVNWQTSNIFDDLDPDTEYTFYQREAETEDSNPSDTSLPLVITTEPLRYRVEVVSERIDATGDGNYKEGETVIIFAGTPYPEQQFIRWTTEHPEVDFDNAEEATTSFIMPASAVTVTAIFEPSIPTPEYTVTVDVNNSEYGLAEGGGTFLKGTKATVKATANDDYKFVNWTRDGVEVSTKNPYTFTVNEDVDLVANFEAIIVPFLLNFETYVITKWEYNTFMLDMRKLSEKYKVTGCKWYEDGKLIGEEFSYSAGNKITNKLKTGIPYHFVLSTSSHGEVRSTDYVISSLRSSVLVAYPNPLLPGYSLTIEGVTEGSYMEIFNQAGVCVLRTIAAGNPATLTLQLPAGLYVIRTKNGDIKIVVTN